MKKTSTSIGTTLRMTKDSYTQGWIHGSSQSNLFELACLDTAFNLFKVFLIASASGKWWWPAAPLGNPGRTPGRISLQIDMHSDFHYVLWSKAQITSAEHSHTFLEALHHALLLSISLHYLLLFVSAFDQKWHGNVHTVLEKNKTMKLQPLHCQKREPRD